MGQCLTPSGDLVTLSSSQCSPLPAPATLNWTVPQRPRPGAPWGQRVQWLGTLGKGMDEDSALDIFDQRRQRAR